MVDTEYEDFPKLPGVNLHELVAGIRQLVDPDFSASHLRDLLTDYATDVMPFLSYEYHLSHGPALYCLIRLTKPFYVVETGVREGESTVSILAAMARNKMGQLYSCDIDLPTARTLQFLDTPFGRQVAVDLHLDPVHRDLFGTSPRLSSFPEGFACPEWHFVMSRGSDLLRDMLVPHGPYVNRIPRRGIDLFFHDSDHSYANQKAEYDLAWDLVRPGGWVGGDDVEWDKQPWAFYELCAARGLKPSFFGKGRMVRKPEA